MKLSISKPNINFAAGLLLSLPTAYFIFISVLKYVFGVPGLFDSIAPALEQWGIRQTIGWNINLLILFGPLTALLLNLSNVLKVGWYSSEEEIKIKILIRKRWMNLSVVIFSTLIILILFAYLAGENCH